MEYEGDSEEEMTAVFQSILLDEDENDGYYENENCKDNDNYNFNERANSTSYITNFESLPVGSIFHTKFSPSPIDYRITK
ncbi:hypothetical protein GcM3_115022 [Golovinomyces cichoracearum]|uniref:Uncharacterized protein n=1 Tax=Golovinomyces cichoracearum TaxID=62708 RepID=A0A420I8B9_9PEZI|nr:hypothetical protein GcM3_115022 [Golovinomyces cichoracearum]